MGGIFLWNRVERPSSKCLSFFLGNIIYGGIKCLHRSCRTQLSPAAFQAPTRRSPLRPTIRGTLLYTTEIPISSELNIRSGGYDFFSNSVSRMSKSPRTAFFKIKTICPRKWCCRRFKNSQHIFERCNKRSNQALPPMSSPRKGWPTLFPSHSW